MFHTVMGTWSFGRWIPNGNTPHFATVANTSTAGQTHRLDAAGGQEVTLEEQTTRANHFSDGSRYNLEPSHLDKREALKDSERSDECRRGPFSNLKAVCHLCQVSVLTTSPSSPLRKPCWPLNSPTCHRATKRIPVTRQPTNKGWHCFTAGDSKPKTFRAAMLWTIVTPEQ